MQKRKLYLDNRGYNSSLFRVDNNFADMNFKFVEDRVSKSVKNTIRGFHGDSKTYKLCTCLYGSLRLIVYDLLSGKKDDLILDELDGQQYLITPFTLNAHQCLTNECVLYYKWTEFYNLESQWSVCYNDPIINPQWVLGSSKEIVSERDRMAPLLKDLII